MSRIKKHLTPSTAIAFLALVFAVTGGAFAATGHGGGGSGATGAKATAAASTTPLASAAKSKGARGPRGPKGATGATGKTGLTGAPGPQGPTGATGATGATGPGGSGEGVTVKTLGPGGPICPGGGAEFSNASGKAHACSGVEGESGNPGEKGAEGSPWTDKGVLPAGATETGTISAATPPGVFVPLPISFTIPLSATIHKADVHEVTSEEQKNEHGKEVPTACRIEREGKKIVGGAEEPVAAPGNLCIYEGGTQEAPPSEFILEVIKRPGFGEPEESASPVGAVLPVQYTGGSTNAAWAGSWAVTAPE